MEYCIEIKGRETQELFVQLYQKTFRWLLVFLVVVYGGYILWVWLTGDELAVQIVSTVLYALLAFLFCQFPKWLAKKAYKTKLKYYDGQMPESISRFGDHILLQDVDSDLKIPYDKIKKVFFLKDCIVLSLVDHKSIGIPNREFTKGSMNELKQFLRAKRPDLNIPE